MVPLKAKQKAGGERRIPYDHLEDRTRDEDQEHRVEQVLNTSYTLQVKFRNYPQNKKFYFLKVLSTEMDPAEIGSFDRSSLKREARKVFRKIRLPPSSDSPSKYQSASLFFNCQLYNNLDSCGEYSLRTWITSFFPRNLQS